MTIDEAIERYTSNAEYERTNGDLQGCLEFKQLAGWLKELKQLREQVKWISVNERLPEDCQRVLVTVVRYNGNSIVRVAEYYSRNNGKGIFQIQENSEQWEVGEKGLLAWMPLPEPYKAESEDKE